MQPLGRRDFLKKAAAMAAGPAVLALGPASCAPGNGDRMPERPNFVFMLVDDLGWKDVACYGSRFYRTPNIDRLAARGVRFTDGYAACPVCSPTRASIMTGKHPARLRLTDYLVGRRKKEGSPIIHAEYRHQLPLDEVTLAEALRAEGYATCHIGKWHLGDRPFYPENQGFEINIGGTGSGMPRSFFYPDWGDNPPIEAAPGDYLPDVIAEHAVEFIRGHADKPFFLYLAHYAVHIPIQAPEQRTEKYRGRIDPADSQDNPVYAAMVESVDRSLGRVLDTLEETGLDGNTVVVFMSDNGGLSVEEGPHTPATSNLPLRAGKGHLYEGGIRVPFIISLPGRGRRGTVCRTPVMSTDFFPTITELAGAVREPGDPADGVSLVPLLTGGGEPERDALYWHYPHFSNQGGMPGGAVRMGGWKLIKFYEHGELELYNIAADIGEQHDLAGGMPGRAAQMEAMLERWLREVGANMPRPNPDYVPPG